MSAPGKSVVRLVWLRASGGSSTDAAYCERCGVGLLRNGYGYSIHHRRRRRPTFLNVHLPANLLLLCGSGTTGCHAWVHSHPLESRTEGFIVPTWEEPSDTGVLTCRGWRLLDNAGGEEPWHPVVPA